MCPHWSTLLTCIIFCSSQLQFGKSFQNKVVFSTFHILTILNKHVHLCYSAKSFSTNMFSLFFNLPEVFSSRTKYTNSFWSFWEVALLYIGGSLKVWFCFLFKDNTSNLSIFFLLFLASSLGGGVLVVDVAGGCLLLPWLSWCLMFYGPNDNYSQVHAFAGVVYAQEHISFIWVCSVLWLLMGE